MISLTILTSNRAQLAQALAARGLLIEDAEAPLGYRPAPGVEIAVVPNTIVTDPGAPEADPPVPPTYDSRWCYMVKLAHEAEAADDDGDEPDPEDDNPRFTRSKVVKFVKRNGTSVILSDGARAWSFANGKHFLLDPRDQGRFGQWQ